MSVLAQTILFVFGLVALGYACGVTGYIKAESGEAISEFAVGVAMPMLLFRTLANIDFHGAAPWHIWGTYFLAAAMTWTAGHIVMTRLFARDARVGVVGGVSSAFSNLVLLGIPFMLGVYGQPGVDVLSLLVAVHLPIMMMASIVLFEMFGARGDGQVDLVKVLKRFVTRVCSNPLILGMLGGFLWRFTGLALPALVTRLVGALADVAGPVALFAMGLGLGKFGISGNVRPALALSFLKLLAMPAVTLLLAWSFGLPPLTAKVAVVAAGMPSGVNSYLIATQFGTGQAIASNQLTIATTLAVVTTGFWLYVAQSVFG